MLVGIGLRIMDQLEKTGIADHISWENFFLPSAASVIHWQSPTRVQRVGMDPPR
jgi:hypothetical protein